MGSPMLFAGSHTAVATATILAVRGLTSSAAVVQFDRRNAVFPSQNAQQKRCGSSTRGHGTPMRHVGPAKPSTSQQKRTTNASSVKVSVNGSLESTGNLPPLGPYKSRPRVRHNRDWDVSWLEAEKEAEVKREKEEKERQKHASKQSYGVKSWFSPSTRNKFKPPYSDRESELTPSQLDANFPKRESEETRVKFMKKCRNAILSDTNPRYLQANSIFDTLIDELGMNRRDFNLVLFDGARLPVQTVGTAFATGWGNIYVKTGMFVQTTNNDMVAFVLLHELAHNIARHIAEQRQFPYNSPDRFARSRLHEFEADEIALKLLLKTRFNPRGGLYWLMELKKRFVERPQDENSTHPSISERIRQQEELLSRL